MFRSKRRLPEENVRESEEHQVVREFCDSTGMPKLCEVRETFQRYSLRMNLVVVLKFEALPKHVTCSNNFRCCELNCVNVVFLLGQELGKDTSGTDSGMRAMLLLEPLLRSDIVKTEV